MPLDELRRYRPDLPEPHDLDDFWRDTLAEARAAGGPATRTAAVSPITEMIVEDLTFPGFGGEPVSAWIIRPHGSDDGRRHPVVVEYNGYGGGRGLAGERVNWALAGYVHVFMDTRGQGSGWGTGGVTADPHGSTPASDGFMTRGILDPREYFYRRVFTDAARLVDAVRELPFVDPDRVALTGGSQGGGITIAAAALTGPTALMPDVAFLCDFRRGVDVAIGGPYQEIARYLAVHRDHVERVFATTAYVDGAVLAPRITAPALFSVALMDDVVPPSTTFAAFNRLGSTDREIEVYGFNGHEGGQFAHWYRQADWLASRI